MSDHKILTVEELKASKPIIDIMESGVCDCFVAKLYLMLTDNIYKTTQDKANNRTIYTFNKINKVYELTNDITIIKDIKISFGQNTEILKEALTIQKTNDKMSVNNTKKETTIKTSYKNYKDLVKYINSVSKINNLYTAINQEIKSDDKYLCSGMNANIQDVILYKNGNLDLKTFELKERTENDYFTSEVVLSYDYETLENPEVNKEYEKMKEMLFHTFNDDEETFGYIINCFAGGLTRRKTDHYFFNIIGDGGNGKTFIFTLATLAFENIYVDKLNNKIIYAKSTNAHKSINDFDSPALCIGYFDEIDKKLINVNEIKDITGGNEIKNEQLYKDKDKSIILKTQIYLITNYILNFKTKEYNSIIRRGRVIKLENYFYDEGEEDKAKNQGVKCYKKDKDYLNKNSMPTARKQAFIHILREGFKNFYIHNSIKDNKKAAEEFAKLVEDNDTFKNFIDIVFEKTGKKTGKTADVISYISLVKAYNQHKQLKNGYTIPDLKADIKRYEKNYNVDGMLRFASDSKKDYKKNGNRGAVYGLKPRHQYLKYFDDEYYDYEPSNNNEEEEGEPINLCSDTETDNNINNDVKLIKEAYEALTTKNKELEEENQKLKNEENVKHSPPFTLLNDYEEKLKVKDMEIEKLKKELEQLKKIKENQEKEIAELKAKEPIKRGRGRPKSKEEKQ